MSSLNSLSFYHGTIDTRECREILPDVGDFLVRNHIKEMDKDAAATAPACVLTVAITPDQASTAAKLIPSDYSFKHQCTTRLKSYAVNGTEGSYSVQGTTDTFPTIQALCEGLVESKKTLPGGGVLQKAVDRKAWQLLLNEIEFPTPEVMLGKGSYGKVVKAKLIRKIGDPIDVAVKNTNEGADETTFSEMYTEARAMRRLQHQHIIRLEGVVVEKLPILLVIEYFEGNCLLSALQKKKVTNVMRFPVICGIMYGLDYMHSNNYIHRDIAARNIMVSADCRSIKIIDFGLAKHGLTFNLSATQKIPVKWLAPEVLKTWTFSTKSDVWAFAITSWEVYHDGAEPYSNMKNVNVKKTHTRKKGKEAAEALNITENVEFIPAGFEALFDKMLCSNVRDRPELTAIRTEIEKKIIPLLSKPVGEEVRLLLEKRYDSKFSAPQTSSNASNSEMEKNGGKGGVPKSPIPPVKPPQQKKNLKTMTRRGKGKKPSASENPDEKSSPRSKDDDKKKAVKISTVRRKNRA